MIVSDLLHVILGLHNMEELIRVALMITPQGDVTQGQFHLGIDLIEDAHIDHALTRGLPMAQGVRVEAHMVAAVAASPLSTLDNVVGD